MMTFELIYDFIGSQFAEHDLSSALMPPVQHLPVYIHKSELACW